MMKISLKDCRLPVSYNPNQSAFLKVFLLLSVQVENLLTSHCLQPPSLIHHQAPSKLLQSLLTTLLLQTISLDISPNNLQMEMLCCFTLKSPQQLLIPFMENQNSYFELFLNYLLFSLILQHRSPCFSRALVSVPVMFCLPQLLHTLQVSA